MKDKNIFDGSKFGDRFLTRNGEEAIFQKIAMYTMEDHYIMSAVLFTESFTICCIIYSTDLTPGAPRQYDDNGKCFNMGTEFDIISKKQ